MSQSIIYNTLQNGSDNEAEGVAIAFIFLLIIGIYFCLRIRSIEITSPNTSASKKTRFIRKLVGKNTFPIIIIISSVSIFMEFFFWRHYTADRDAMLHGDYQSLTASVDSFESIHVAVMKRGKPTFGIEPTLREKDALKIAGHTFFVECDRPPETPAADVGRPGTCLKLKPQQTITVDFIAPTATTYRTDPLQILAAD